MRIAIAERWPAPDSLGDCVASAAAHCADLLMLPEAAADGRPELSDGDTARRLVDRARGAGVAILAGYVEHCITGVYGAALLVDRRGVCTANYRQAHARSGALGGREPGHWLTITPLGDLRIGILLGYDIEFPEAARALALSGCDLLAVLGGASDDDADMFLPARARENRCWLGYAGPAARLLDPAGRACAVQPLAAGLVIGTVDRGAHPPEAAQADLTTHRRPQLYRALLHGLEDEARPN